MHPAFTFNGRPLPDNAVGGIYRALCEKYCLLWSHKQTRGGMIDFMEPPRPIVRTPQDFEHRFDPDTKKLTLEFALERGCYANVALRELMKAEYCPGQEEIVLLPAHPSWWETKGREDPSRIEAVEDVYPGFQSGYGFVDDEVDVASQSKVDVFAIEGPLHADITQDPARKAYLWSRANYVREAKRREKEALRMRHQLFENSLVETRQH